MRQPDTKQAPREPQALWDGVIEALRQEVPRPVVAAMLEGSRGMRLTDRSFVVQTKESFQARYMDMQYALVVSQVLYEEYQLDREVWFMGPDGEVFG